MAVYPGLPDNRLIVNGVDLTERYKLVLADGYKLNPPEPVTSYVDIPGSPNGPLDLTEALTGDIAFKNRTQQFTFYLLYPENFEKTKTELTNLLHGRAFRYKMTMDPEYTYFGRFTIESYESDDQLGKIVISISAEPYKLKKQYSYKVDAAGGKRCVFESGRLPVHPIVETTSPTTITFDGITISVGIGTWRLNDVTFTEGENVIYFKSLDLTKLTWDDAGQNGTYPTRWAAAVTWDDFHKKAGGYDPDEGVVYVVYDWKDL